MSKYAVMLFKTELELGISNKPEQWINYYTFFTDNSYKALEYYANTPCPASQLIKAEKGEDIDQLIEEMKNNYKDKKWLNENLYPFL